MKFVCHCNKIAEKDLENEVSNDFKHKKSAAGSDSAPFFGFLKPVTQSKREYPVGNLHFAHIRVLFILKHIDKPEIIPCFNG